MANSPPDPNLLTVGEVAKLAHVSVRTLHHYDEIGLLEPARRTDAGYRLYGPAELARLHEVLLFRELGLSLDDIASLLDQPAADRARALLTHRRALEHRRHIDRWFYPCPPAMHAGLADMHESDPRFAQYFEQRAEGLTGYVATAIRSNAGG